MTNETLATEQKKQPEYTITVLDHECRELINLCNNCSILANTLKDVKHVLSSNQSITRYPSFLKSFIAFLQHHTNDSAFPIAQDMAQSRILNAAKEVNLFLETLPDKLGLLSRIRNKANQLSRLLNKKRVASKAAQRCDDSSTLLDNNL